MGIDDITNLVAIDDRIATAGQPSEDQFRAVREAGYDVVINLAPDGLETSLPDEARLLRELGIEYHHIPVAWTAPTIEDLQAFAAAMAAAAERRTLIHCQANYRVTAFFALYAQAQLGWTDAQAQALVDRIWTSRPGYAMDETWTGFMAEGRKTLGIA